MKKEILNVDLLSGNTCFGCGHDNPHGLHIELYRDEVNPKRIVGTFLPTQLSTGFPGITHGGAVYAALDCLTTWTATMLRGEPGALWLLRSANVTYHQPTPIDRPVALMGEIAEQGDLWQAVVVHAEARTAQGDLLVDGMFRTIPVPKEKFEQIAGIDSIPENWQKFLDDVVGG